MTDWTRREFVRASAALAAGLGARTWGQDSRPAASRPSFGAGSVSIGASKVVVPRLGLGCFPLSAVSGDADGAAVVRRALALGLRYFDTAPSYGAGASERRIGIALQGSRREDLYIATKTLERKADAARAEVDASLTRLQTKYVDCVQIHEVHDDWEGLFARGGVVEGLERCCQEGIVRSIGITGHRDPSFLRHALERFPFVSALVPVNPIDPQHLSFVRDFLPFAAERGTAVVAMKVFAGGKLLRDKILTVKDCIDYALSLPQVAVAVPGCATVEELDEVYAAAAAHRPLERAALGEIEAKAGTHRGKATEWYKDERHK